MGYNVLIVDDSQTMRKVIRKSVDLSGLPLEECWEAGNGVEALNLLASHPIDVILTDFNMPEMNGLEMIRELQKDKKHGRIPVVLITTHSHDWVIQEALSLGVKGFIRKPFHPEAIRDLLSQVMEEKSA